MSDEKVEKSKGRKVKKSKASKPRKAKQVKVWDTDLDKLSEADQLLKRIEQQEALCDERAAEVEIARDEFKQRRGAYAAAVLELRRLCRARKEKHPLFDQAAKKPDVRAVMDSAPVIDYNQPRTAVTIELTEDCMDIDQQLVGGNTYHPWGVSREGCTLLLVGRDVFVPKARFRYTTGQQLVEDALLDEQLDALNAATWEEWLLARPECRRRGADGAAEATPTAGDGWRGLPLSAAGINSRPGELLQEAGYDTLGKLADLMRDRGQWWPKEVRGIGEAAVAEIVDAFVEFWKEHPEYCAA